MTKRRQYGEWNRSTVHNILRCETYAGVWRYGKRSKIPYDPSLTVKVAAIVNREIWEAAQRQLAANKDDAKRNLRHEYLLRRRVICGDCGCKAICRTLISKGKKYAYYHCHAKYRYALSCNMTTEFRIDLVDTAVWGWVRDLLTDPTQLIEGLKAQQVDRERLIAPLRQRLAVVDDLLDENRRQLEKLLDLYLTEAFSKDLLTERKARLEAAIAVLERERVGLATRIETQVLTDEQIQAIQGFSAQVNQGLALAEADFATRRRLIEALDVWVTLAIEDGEKVVYVRCLLGENVLSIASNTTEIRGSVNR